MTLEVSIFINKHNTKMCIKDIYVRRERNDCCTSNSSSRKGEYPDWRVRVLFVFQ